MVLAPDFEFFTKYDAFSPSFDYACFKATQAYSYDEAQNYGKFLFIQSIVENGWWEGMHPPHPPGSAPVYAFNLQISPEGAKWLALRTTL